MQCMKTQLFTTLIAYPLVSHLGGPAHRYGCLCTDRQPGPTDLLANRRGLTSSHMVGTENQGSHRVPGRLVPAPSNGDRTKNA